MRKLSRIVPVLIAVSLLAACGDDDGDGDGESADRTATDEALFSAEERLPDVEKDIVRRAKVEDTSAGNDPADYRYDVECVTKSEVKLTCRLDLTDEAGKVVNTVAYAANVDPDSGGFGYTVTANRDTRPEEK